MAKKNKHLSITACNYIKFIAIFLVLVGHYFKESTSLNFLHSVGFFGAALFAFLSGYGIMISYLTKGIINLKIWIFKKISKIYFPVIFINLVQQFFLYKSSKNIFLNIFWISNDSILWYIPYVLAYDILFGMLFFYMKDIKKAILCMLIIELSWYIFAQCLGLGSQWYTSTGALFLGMFVANHELSSKIESVIIFPTALLALFNAYLSKKLISESCIKDSTTLFAGLFFTWFVFLILKKVEEEYGECKNNIISYLGTYSLWIYITHKKILHYFFDVHPIYFILFFIMSILVAMITQKIYSNLKSLNLK